MGVLNDDVRNYGLVTNEVLNGVGMKNYTMKYGEMNNVMVNKMILIFRTLKTSWMMYEYASADVLISECMKTES